MFLPSIRMIGKIINFRDLKNIFLQKQEQKAFKIDDTDVDKILVSKREPYGTNKSIKYFVRYSDNDVIRPLFIIFPKMIRYVKCYNSNKTMSSIVKYGRKQQLSW